MSDKLYLPKKEFEEWAKNNNLDLTLRKNARLTYKSRRTLLLFKCWLTAYEKGVDRCLYNVKAIERAIELAVKE